MDKQAITVGYWNIRGLAAPLRMQTMYSGTPLDNVSYDIIVDPVTGKSDANSWFDAKSALKVINPLVNLPYIKDGDKLISQSNACFLYLGRKLNMLGDNDDELCQCEQLLCEIMDLRNSIVGYAYSQDKGTSQELTDNFIKSNAVIKVLDKLSLYKQMNINDAFFIGNKASSPDFHAWELFDQLKNYSKFHSLEDIILRFPPLESFYIAFKNLPNNQKYLLSKLYTYPMNNKSSSIGGTPNGGKYDKSMECTWNTYDGIYY